MSKVKEKKELKETAILEAAYDLFSTKGIKNTSIKEITSKAGVAKGTFYLYYKNKYTLLDQLIIKKSNKILMQAYDQTIIRNFSDYKKRVLFFVTQLIDYLNENPTLLKILHKNLSWGLFNQAVEKTNLSILVNKLIKDLYGDFTENKPSEENFYITLFMILELTSSVCYNSIIKNNPKPIHEMKPILLNMIKKMMVTNKT